MDIQGLDKIKKTDNNEKEEIRVTGLDFNKKPDISESTASKSFDFIKKLENDPSESQEHGVTGLEFINNKGTLSDASSVTGLDFISREGEGNSDTKSPKGLDFIKQLNFSDMGIIRHDE